MVSKSQYVNSSSYELSRLKGKIALLAHVFQHLCFFVANSAVIPVVVGNALHLSHLEVVELVQRSLIINGLASMLQAFWGHRFPIFEGPAGLWYSTFLTLAATAPLINKPFSSLSTDLELGLILAGAIIVVIGVTGMLGKVVSWFSPLVNGTFLFLMSIQLSGSILRGMLGVNSNFGFVRPAYILVAVVTVVTAVILSLKFRGFLQTIGILFGTGLGWITAYFLGITESINLESANFLVLPRLFAWGRPTVDYGILLTCVLTGLVLLSNVVVSIQGLAQVTNQTATKKMFNRGALITGFSTLLAGFGATVGVVPYASSIGFAAITQVFARLPFIIAAIILMVLGLAPTVGAFFASMPLVVGNSIVFISFTLCVGQGAKEFAKLPVNNVTLYRVGIPVMVGTGIMFVPETAFSQLPLFVRQLSTNGVIIGVILSLILDRLLGRREPTGKNEG